jgi:hypothetical protein
MRQLKILVIAELYSRKRSSVAKYFLWKMKIAGQALLPFPLRDHNSAAEEPRTVQLRTFFGVAVSS